MNIFIDNKNSTPIYEQIYTQIKDLIINGTLKENESLPSIRNLAKDLRISVITTKRAYEELERSGFIYVIPAKGCFVAEKNTELLREENLKKIEEHMNCIIKLSSSCNLTKDDVLKMWDIMWEE
ncbi:MAG: GntR family transcriptional regulator [Eubacteriaceae bacterium]|nr:GntR family transcriptional regulator [Eubacteriaceae bacterium]